MCVDSESFGLFLKNKISVYNLSLKNVAVYAYRNKTGKANWEIVKTSSDTLAVEKDTISQNKFDSEIDIRQVELEHANLILMIVIQRFIHV